MNYPYGTYVVCFLWAFGCSEGTQRGDAGTSEHVDADSPARHVFVASLVEDVILPMVTDSAKRARQLFDASEGFCAAPEDADIDDLRDAWSRARRAYKVSEAIGFGPHTARPWRLEDQVDFWPARTDVIDGVIGGDEDLGDPETKLDEAARGLPAIEYVLYAGDDPQGALVADARRCQYLVFISRDLRDRMQLLSDVWRDEFAAELLVQSDADRYDDINDSLAAVVNHLALVVERARDDKLGRPAGTDTGGDPRPDMSESRFSGRSVEDIIDNLRGVDAVFRGRIGDADNREARGLGWLLQEERGLGTDAFDARMSAAMDALSDIYAPLTLAVTAFPAQVEDARDALRGLQRYLQTDLAQALSVPTPLGDAGGH